MAAGASRPLLRLLLAALLCVACPPPGGGGFGASAQLVSPELSNSTLVLTSQGFAQALGDASIKTILLDCETSLAPLHYTCCAVHHRILS